MTLILKEDSSGAMRDVNEPGEDLGKQVLVDNAT